jgi:uncharacterized protein
MDQIEVIRKRQQKDHEFKASAYSPLSPQQQTKFDGLQYFEPNPSLAFELKPEPFVDQAHIKMQTSQGEVQSYIRWGRVKFQIDGEESALTLYYTPAQAAFFVPFMDSTTGEETYGAGRYVEVDRLSSGNVRLDFNDAYNPYCAYSPQWSCPIPPVENRLKVPIRAGEKQPVGEWVETVHE